VTRPRIGIPLDFDERRVRYEVGRAYADAVWQAGGLPLPLASLDGSAADYLLLCDGLLVTGGAFDIPPERYGEARRPSCGAPPPPPPPVGVGE
jgi:putative glutamine amidotransferase